MPSACLLLLLACALVTITGLFGDEQMMTASTGWRSMCMCLSLRSFLRPFVLALLLALAHCTSACGVRRSGCACSCFLRQLQPVTFVLLVGVCNPLFFHFCSQCHLPGSRLCTRSLTTLMSSCGMVSRSRKAILHVDTAAERLQAGASTTEPQ